MKENSFFQLESDNDPHLLVRLVGLIVRRGGQIRTLSCDPAAGEKLHIELEVLGGRGEFLKAHLQKTEGVGRVILTRPGLVKPITQTTGG